MNHNSLYPRFMLNQQSYNLLSCPNCYHRQRWQQLYEGAYKCLSSECCHCNEWQSFTTPTRPYEEFDHLVSRYYKRDWPGIPMKKCDRNKDALYVKILVTARRMGLIQ